VAYRYWAHDKQAEHPGDDDQFGDCANASEAVMLGRCHGGNLRHDA